MKKIFCLLLSLIMFFGVILSADFVYAEGNGSNAEAGAYNDPNKENFSINEDGTIVKETDIKTSVDVENDGDKKTETNSKARKASEITSSSVAVVNFRTKSSSSENTNYTEVGTERSGYINGYYAADGAFLGFDNDSNPTKVKFLQAGVIGWVNFSDVEVLNYTDSAMETTSKYYVSNGRLYHGIVNNLSSTSYSSSLDCGPKPSYLQEGKTYFSYDGHYFYTYNTSNLVSSFSTMLNDYRNNVRTNAINSNNPYYNYYLYLSHRSITTYTSDQLDKAIAHFCGTSESSYGRTSKMRNLGSTFISNQDTYGVNALLMIGVAANESAWGCSSIAANKNNLFGHAAYDSDPNGSSNAYSSVEYSVYYHAARFVSKGYLDCITDSRYYGSFLGDKASGMAVKYASDPYWGEKAAAIAWRVDSYLGGSDSYKYTIGIKDILPSDHNVVEIKSSASSSSTTLYKTYPVSSKTTYKSYAPSNYAFIILKDGQSNGYYKIQCDSEVNSARSAIVNQEKYSFSNSFGYIPTGAVKIVSNGSNSISIVNKNTSNVEGQPTGKGDSEPTLYYQSNVKSYGWLEEVNEPNTTGTTGQSLDLYQLKIRIANVSTSAILTGKVYTNSNWINYSNIKSSTVIGNANASIQKINFNLSGVSGYKLQYRVHSADIGWQSWVDAGNDAGTAGKNIQAIDFRLVAVSSIPITSIELNKTSTSIVKNSSETLKATIMPSNTTDNRTITWTSSNTNVATVDSNGKVTGIAAGSCTITATTSNGKTATCQVTVTNQKPDVNYQTHVQNVGWQGIKTNGELSGTTGKSLRLEGIKISLANNSSYTGTIQYRTHIQNIGWQDWKSNGAFSGTEGKSLRLEAIQIQLTGEIANYYDIYYRVHAQEFGWLDWAKNGERAGSAGYAYRLEAIEIRLVEKGGNVPGSTSTPYHQKNYIGYKTHVQNVGWQAKVYDGSTSGTTGKSLRLEGIQINLENPLYEGNVEYRTHIQNIGWETSWKRNGSTSGTSGKSLRLEAIQIRLTGEMANQYDIYYRVHAQDYDWLGWAKNGERAGTEGLSKRLEGIQIVLVEKGGSAPGSTSNAFIVQGNINYQTHIQNNDWQDIVKNSSVSGTKGKFIDAIRISLGENEYSGGVEYSTHVQNIGWTNYVSNGETSGTENQSKKIEAIKIRLTGEISNYYNIYYSVYSSSYGWLDWAKNDNISGTTGGAFGIESIKIMILPKIVSMTSNTSKSSLYFTNNNGYLVCKNAGGNLVNDVQTVMGKQSSYVLRVNKSTNVVTVLAKNGTGNYNIAFKRFVCSVGNATPTGTFYTPAKYRWHTLMGPSYGQWCTRIVDGILFHSVFYSKMNNRTLSVSAYNKLGTTASHGCVRLTCGDAKWIYDNCSLKTKVIVVVGGADPLSKPSAAKLPSWHTWDPTDPTI